MCAVTGLSREVALVSRLLMRAALVPFELSTEVSWEIRIGNSADSFVTGLARVVLLQSSMDCRRLLLACRTIPDPVEALLKP